MVGPRSLLVFVFGLLSCGGPEEPRTKTSSSGLTVTDPSPDEGPETGTPVGEDTGVPRTQGLVIEPGLGIGPAAIGDGYWEFVGEYGEPDSLIAYRRTFFATWTDLGVELVVTSSDDLTPSADAEVIALGTKAFDGFSGPVLPGMTMQEVETAIGVSPDPVDLTHFYPSGIGVVYAGNETVMQITIFPAFTIRTEPPEMVSYGDAR